MWADLYIYADRSTQISTLTDFASELLPIELLSAMFDPMPSIEAKDKWTAGHKRSFDHYMYR